MKKKRVVVISDLHCGHLVGLTPPQWYRRNPEGSKKNKYLTVQRQCWDFYASTIRSLGKIDILIVNGDCIDGRGEKTGSTELIETNRKEQCTMAVNCIKFANAKSIYMTYGTSYHTGDKEDWEEFIADKLGAKIGAHEWLEINGNIIDIKHHIGGSEWGGLSNDRIQNVLWSLHSEQPKADIIIRSHIHRYRSISDGYFTAITTPALQGMGSKYGARRCNKRVDFGFVVIDFDEKGGFTCTPYLAKVEAQKAKAIKL